MIISKIQGGLGNQMFQYAIGRAYAEKLKTNLCLDLSFYRQPFEKDITPRKFELDLFNVKYTVAEQSDLSKFHSRSYWYRLKRKLGMNVPIHYREGNDCNIKKRKKDIYLDGYWQSESFFKDFSEIINADFQFKKALNKKSEDIATKIKSKVTSVSIHLRRGDYVSSTLTNAYHGVCDIEYYKKAVGYLKDRISDPYFFVFSDDIDWARANFLPMFDNMEVVPGNEGDDSWQDMYLMSTCHHNIIANSSFSWWAAWLNNNRDKVVIAPQNWFATAELNNDIHQRIPAGWILY